MINSVEKLGDVFDTEFEVYLNAEDEKNAEVALKRMLTIAKVQQQLHDDDFKSLTDSDSLEFKKQMDLEKIEVEKQRLELERMRLDADEKKKRFEKIGDYAGLGIKLTLGVASLLFEYKIGKMMFSTEKDGYVDTPYTVKQMDKIGKIVRD